MLKCCSAAGEMSGELRQALPVPKLSGHVNEWSQAKMNGLEWVLSLVYEGSY